MIIKNIKHNIFINTKDHIDGNRFINDYQEILLTRKRRFLARKENYIASWSSVKKEKEFNIKGPSVFEKVIK